ncbi:MAG: hypothetical protein LRZ85_04270 [Alphaproteobacteria bacterium]|nr:hypothetical protein [Alphaproteobacteria bacterium]
MAGISGIFFGYLFYLIAPFLPGLVVKQFGFFHRIVFNKYYFDELYDRLFVRTSKRLGQAFWYAGDQNVIDALGPNGSAAASKFFAGLLSRFQSGFVYQYAFVMMIAVIGLMSWFFFKLNSGM